VKVVRLSMLVPWILRAGIDHAGESRLRPTPRARLERRRVFGACSCCCSSRKTYTGVLVKACSAFYDAAEEEVVVFAELVTEGGEPLSDYRALHVALYDKRGRLLGTEFEFWSEFGLRRTSRVSLSDVYERPALVRVFTAKSP
jgi:hypothetical protein